MPPLSFRIHFISAHAAVVLTVSVRLDGEYGLQGVCLSVPCQVTEEGVARIPEVILADEEMARLRHSATVLRKSLGQLQS